MLPLAVHAVREEVLPRATFPIGERLCVLTLKDRVALPELSFPCAEVDPGFREHSLLQGMDGPCCSRSSSSGAQGTTCPGWTSDATLWTRRMASYRRAWVLKPGLGLGPWPHGQPSCVTCHPTHRPPTALLGSCPTSSWETAPWVPPSSALAASCRI